VVADSFTRLYPTANVTVATRSLFETLNAVADAMGAHWRRDTGFIEGRTIGYYWDRRKEVPNRLLDRWCADSRRNGGLPLDDLIEMSTLSDEQLDSTVVGDAIVHCRQLPEWDLLQQSTSNPSARPFIRLMATMSREQRVAIQQPEGMAFSPQSPAEQRMLFNLVTRDQAYVVPQVIAPRFRIDYVPSSRYVWRPVTDGKRQLETARWPIVSGKTADEVLAAARQWDPTASADQVLKGDGVLTVTEFDDKNNACSIAGVRPAIYR
jgi:hypothetical protein